MADYLLTSTLVGASGLPQDRFVNTFAVHSTDPLDAGQQEAMCDELVAFWQQIPAGGLSQPAALIGPQISRSASHHMARLYDITDHLDGSPHGSPLAEVPFAMTPAVAGNPLPTEVAYCVTLHGFGREVAPVEVPDGIDPGDAVDRPKQRRTGRVYFGPFTVNAVSNVGGVARPTAQIRDTFTLGLHSFARGISAVEISADLGVWSRTDGTVRRLEATSTDDSFDTQRRRGEDPTVRLIVAYVP